TGIAFAQQPLLDFYNNSQMVLVGKVISLSQVPTTLNDSSQSQNQTRYDIQVEKYYKDPQSAKLVTVYGYAKGIYFSQDPTYNVGDRVFLYLNEENGYYQIQSHSLKLENNCDARPMIPMTTLPFEPPPISSPIDGHDFYLSDTGGNPEGFVPKGDNVTINFNAQNDLPIVKSATIELIVTANNDTVMDDKKSVLVSACNGQIPMRWTFTPDVRGQYVADINVTGSYDFAGKYFLFSEPVRNIDFAVLENNGGQVIHKGPFLLPLQQLKDGTAPMDVTCLQGLQLVIKSEDGTPACVKPDTAQELIERGWGMNISSNNTDTADDGMLSGNVTLAGGPSVGPQANYEVDVYATDGITIVGKTFSDINAHYSIPLPAGKYIIYVQDYPKPIQHLFSVFKGKTTTFDISYGTNYR
ncbi:MAG: hypothetical protein ACRDFB_01765, partial [Rhabdochlamydiaceae bacterium]